MKTLSRDTVLRRPGLGALLAFAFSMLAVLLAFVLSLVIDRRASVQIGSDAGAYLAELANQTVTRLDRSMHERHREIRLLARRAETLTDPRALQAELDTVQASYAYYAWMGVTDAQGRVRAASGGLLAGADVSSRPWFQQALRGVHLGDVHEAKLLAGLVGRPGEEPPRFYDIAFPLRDGGVLGAHVNWDWAKDVRAAVFRPIGRSHEVDPLILSSNGVVLLGPRDVMDQRLHLASVRRALDGETGFEVETWPDGERYVVGFSRSRGWQDSPGLGWAVLVRQELAEANAPLLGLKHEVWAAGLVLAALFSLVGLLVAYGITRPLKRLADSARAVGTGQGELVEQPGAYREVDSLAHSLTALLRELHVNQQALRDLNAELEQRVADRTRELQEAFERVRANEQRIQTILEAAQDPFIGVDLEGRITDWNTQAEIVFGWAREEVLGRRVGETLVPPRYAEAFDRALRGFRQARAGDLLHRPIERLMVDRQGREIPVEVKVGYVATGREEFFGAFVHDISERKEVERMKDEFVSTVSHELRTPLTSIYGSLDLLVGPLARDLPADARQLLAIAHESTERLIRLINDLLDLEKMASGKLEYRLERQPLRPLLTRALRDTAAYAAGLGVRLVLSEGADAEVRADADRIVQVCVNLLSNAAKFSPRGGAVEIGLSLHDGAARVGVVDHGSGIPAAFRDRMFERFAQADSSDRRAQSGTGLGLSICRSIIEAHGGRIDFTSEPGVRTEFWFELPLVDETGGEEGA